MKTKKRNLFAVFLFLFLILVFFRNYFFKGQIPFPANFLVSFFQPWASETIPGWEQGVPSKPQGIDNLKIFYPQRIFTNRMIDRGQIPFWNPYNFSGNVHLANSQTAVFYPFFFLFYLPFLKPIFVWSLLVVIQPLVSGIFTYLFLKLIIRDWLAALYGAIVFSFSGLMITRWEDGLVIGHSAIWLPFILFNLEKYWLTSRKKYVLLATFGLLSSLLTGWLQMTFYVWLVSFLYAFFRRKKPVIYPFISALFLAGFHLLPALEALSLSPRGLNQSQELLDRFLATKEHLLTFLAPDFFGNPAVYNFFGKGFYQETMLSIGLVPLALALWALISFWRQEKTVLFFGLLGLLSLSLGFDLPTTRWLLTLPLPIISSFLPTRIFFINTFCFAVLSGYGLRWLRQDKKRIILKLILAVFLLAFFWAKQRTGWDWQGGSEISSLETKVMVRNLILPLAVFLGFSGLVLTARFWKKQWLIASLFILTIFPQLYLANKFLYASEKEFLYPPHPVFEFLRKKANINRFWSWGKSHILPNTATYYQIYSPEGVDAMYPTWYGELIEAVDQQGEIRKNVPRIEPLINQVGDAAIDWENKFRYRFLSLTGVKYIVGLKTERFLPPAHSFQKVWEEEKWAAWEYQKALPRAFWVANFVVEPDKQKRADLVFDPQFPLDKKVVLEEPVIGDWDFQEEGEGRAEVISYQPNKVILEVESGQDGLVFLSDVYYPGWKVLIDNQKGKIYQANYAFRAVPIASGKHQVVFSYFPQSFQRGLLLSLSGLLTLAIWLGWGRIRKQKCAVKKLR